MVTANMDSKVVSLSKETEHTKVSDTECSSTINLLFRDGLYNCNKCPRKIKRQDNFKRHYLNVHGLIYQTKSVTDNSKNVCIYPECSKIFYHKSKMLDHLKEDHRINVKSEEKTFYSFENFMKWKTDEESKNFVFFVKRDERETSKSMFYSSYVCKCDGIIRNNINLASNTEENLAKYLICPARMLVKKNINTGKISVQYIKSHNHSISTADVIKHPIPSAIRDTIVNKLKEHKSVNQVYSELHQEASINLDLLSLKKVLIEKKQIYHLQRKFELTNDEVSHVPFYDFVSFKFRLMQLDQVHGNYSSILISRYCDHENYDESKVVFGFQTYYQNELLKQYGEIVIFFEEMLATPNLPFNMLSLKITDELGHCYNVAHLVCANWSDEVNKIFFHQIHSRCKLNFKVNAVMTSLSSHTEESFKSVFGFNCNFIYSKWHLHQLFFSKLLSDYPKEKDLRHQVYFTLCALIEETDQQQFKSIMTEFINSYQEKCPNFIKFMMDNYFNKPEKWALSYREVGLRNIDHVMHLNDLMDQIKSETNSKKSKKNLNEILHTILNINQSCWLKKQHKLSVNDMYKEHDKGLSIPDCNVCKISETQWIVTSSQDCKYEVNWNSDKCSEKFCKNRCLRLVCFALCVHLYYCNCEEARKRCICSHIHKVHSLETGVYSFQNTHVLNEEKLQQQPNLFKLFEGEENESLPNESVLTNNFDKTIEYLKTIEKILKKKQETIKESTLEDVNRKLEIILEKFNSEES